MVAVSDILLDPKSVSFSITESFLRLLPQQQQEKSFLKKLQIRDGGESWGVCGAGLGPVV
jgi:hypothetical protein